MDQNKINKLFDAALLADLPEGAFTEPEAPVAMEMEEDMSEPADDMDDGFEGAPMALSAMSFGAPMMAMASRAAPPQMGFGAAFGGGGQHAQLRKRKAMVGGRAEFAARDMETRQAMEHKQLYRPPEKTKEYAERGYWGHKQGAATRDLIHANRFWEDCARKMGAVDLQSVLSARWFEACNSASEALLMLAVLDVPFVNHTDASFPKEGGVVVRPTEPAVIFARQLNEVHDREDSALLVNQNFFDNDARQETDEDGNMVDKYVRDEYVC